MNVRRALLLLALLCISPAALAKTPCEDLTGEVAKKYNALGDTAIERYGAEDYPGAIEAILAIKAICAEDPRLDYNLARAYHRAENCNLARFWYEEVLARSADDLGDDLTEILEKQKKKALASITELEQVCANSARLSVSCVDEDVSITIADLVDATCPAGSRVDPGQYELIASKEGKESFRVPVTLKAGASASLIVPQLQDIRFEATTGTVRLSCLANVTEVDATLPDGTSATWPCPSEQEVVPGNYTLSVASLGIAEEVTVDAGDTSNVRLATQIVESDPIFFTPDEELRLGAWISLGSGLGLLAGGIALHLVALDMYTQVAEPGGLATVNGANGDTFIVTSLTQSEAIELAENAELLDTIGWITAGVGGAALITGVVLLIVSDPEEAPPANVSASFTRDGVLLHIGGSF